MATAAQVVASRLNGALSQGPTSETGKATSSLNALKTGLTGRTVLLPSEDAALYEAHLAQFRERYQPVGGQELALVQSLADTHWRLARIPSLEAGIYALGRLEFAELFPDQEEGVRKQLIEAKVYLAYHRQLANLSIQEGRLRRQAEKDLAALEALAAAPAHPNPVSPEHRRQSLHHRCAPAPARIVRSGGARVRIYTRANRTAGS